MCGRPSSGLPVRLNSLPVAVSATHRMPSSFGCSQNRRQQALGAPDLGPVRREHRQRSVRLGGRAGRGGRCEPRAQFLADRRLGLKLRLLRGGPALLAPGVAALAALQLSARHPPLGPHERALHADRPLAPLAEQRDRKPRGHGGARRPRPGTPRARARAGLVTVRTPLAKKRGTEVCGHKNCPTYNKHLRRGSHMDPLVYTIIPPCVGLRSSFLVAVAMHPEAPLATRTTRHRARFGAADRDDDRHAVCHVRLRLHDLRRRPGVR